MASQDASSWTAPTFTGPKAPRSGERRSSYSRCFTCSRTVVSLMCFSAPNCACLVKRSVVARLVANTRPIPLSSSSLFSKDRNEPQTREPIESVAIRQRSKTPHGQLAMTAFATSSARFFTRTSASNSSANVDASTTPKCIANLVDTMHVQDLAHRFHHDGNAFLSACDRG